MPVDVDEGEGVPGVLGHLLALLRLAELVLAHADLLPVLPPPGDGWSVLFSIQTSSVNDYDKIGKKICNFCPTFSMYVLLLLIIQIISYLGVPVASQLRVTDLPSVARVSPLLVSSMMLGGTAIILSVKGWRLECPH